MKARGINHYRWKGGRFKTNLGYVKILKPEHHFATWDGYVFEHRLVYELFNKCCLLPNAIIHHINGIKDDNRIQNLYLVSREEHPVIERFKDMSKRFCSKCKSSSTQIIKKSGRPYWYHDDENLESEDNLLCHKCYNRKIRRLKKLNNKFHDDGMKKIVFKVCKRCWHVGCEVEPDGSLKCILCGMEN